jgi:predicted nucleic acid-binding protein
LIKIYFDSSAYVKLFKQEPGTESASLLFRLAHDKRIQILMSYWTINETSAAIDRTYRRGEISDENYPIIRATLLKNLILYGDQGSNVGIVPLHNSILRNSIDVINQFHVSADDALHLYTAFAMNCNYFLCDDYKLLNKTGGEISNMKVLSVVDPLAMNKLIKELDTN